MDILNKMQEVVDTKNKMIDQTYENITTESKKGNKDAQTIIDYAGTDDELIKLISKAI